MLEALDRETELAGSRVVFFDDHERPRDLPPDVLWVQGNPTKESELDKVRLTHAVGGDRGGCAGHVPPQSADASSHSHHVHDPFLPATRTNEQVRLRKHRAFMWWSRFLDSENVRPRAQAAGADEVIETRKIGYSMVAHAVGFHGTATAMSRLLISGAHNVYIGVVPVSHSEPVEFGRLLAELQLSKQGGLVVGLRRPSGEEIINPPKSTPVTPGTHLLYLAEKPLLEAPG